MGKKTKSFSIIFLILGVTLLTVGAIYPATLEKKVNNEIPRILNSVSQELNTHYDSVVEEYTFEKVASDYRDDLVEEIEDYLNESINIRTLLLSEFDTYTEKMYRVLEKLSLNYSFSESRDEMVSSIPYIADYSASANLVELGTQSGSLAITNQFFNDVAYTFTVDGIVIDGISKFLGESLSISEEARDVILNGNQTSQHVNVSGVLSDLVLGYGVSEFISGLTAASSFSADALLMENLLGVYVDCTEEMLNDILDYFESYLIADIIPDLLEVEGGTIITDLLALDIFDPSNALSFANYTGLDVWLTAFYGSETDPMGRFTSRKTILDEFSISSEVLDVVLETMFDDILDYASDDYGEVLKNMTGSRSFNVNSDNFFFDQWANLTSSENGFIEGPIGIELPLVNGSVPSGLSREIVEELFDIDDQDSLLSENGSIVWIDSFETRDYNALDIKLDLTEDEMDLILDWLDYINSTYMPAYYSSKLGISPVTDTADIDPMDVFYAQWTNGTVFKTGINNATDFNGYQSYSTGFELGINEFYVTNCTFIDGYNIGTTGISLETAEILWDSANTSSLLSSAGIAKWMNIDENDYDGLNETFNLSDNQMIIIIEWISSTDLVFKPSYICRDLAVDEVPYDDIDELIFAEQWLHFRINPEGIANITDYPSGFEVGFPAGSSINYLYVVQLFNSSDEYSFTTDDGLDYWMKALGKYNRHTTNPERDFLNAHFLLSSSASGRILEWLDEEQYEMANQILIEETGTNNLQLAFIFKFLMPLGFISLAACVVILIKAYNKK